MNTTVAAGLCETVGTVINHPKMPIEDGGGFMRVRVLVDVSQPLCRGRVICLEDGKELWVSFKYERLPNLCYWCGRLTHNDRDCELWLDSEGTLEDSDKRYGPWIRAPPFVSSRKAVFTVPGFYCKNKNIRKEGNSDGFTRQSPATDRPHRASDAPQTNQESAGMEGEINAESSSGNSFLSQNAQTSHNQAIPELAHSTVSMVTFEKQIEEIDREIRKFDFPFNADQEQIMDTENISLQCIPPHTTISSPNPSPTPSPPQNSNITEETQNITPAPPSTFTPKTTIQTTIPAPPKNSNTSTPNPTLPIPDKTHEKHANPHPIITRTSPPLHIPNHHSTTPQFPKPTSPQHHTTKNTSVSSLQNRAPTNTHPLATWKRIPRNTAHEALTKTALLGQKRAAPHHDHQSELPSKKFMVSQIDNETPLLLAEAGSQPCQEP